MPKRFSIVDKRRWLEKHESGKSEPSIAREAGCDARTVKKGIDEARREVYARTARAELLKEALRKHQASLLGTLEQLLSSLNVSRDDLPFLKWNTSNFIAVEGEFSPDVALSVEYGSEWNLLKEHTKRDSLWKVYDRRQRAIAAHLKAKVALQHKTVSLIEEKTGYKVVDDGQAISPPFVRISATGSLFFEVAIRRILGIRDDRNLDKEIVTDTASGEVKHVAITLAKAPGKEAECKDNLLTALRELEQSSEALDVSNTYKVLEESNARARKAVEEMLLLGLVPGQCRICRRLGM